MTRGRVSILPAEQIAFDRLVVVTNREPFQIVMRDKGLEIERSTGGLIAALEPAMKEYPGLWISGVPHNLSGNDLASAHKSLKGKTPFAWKEAEYEKKWHHGFYAGFSNRVLWPLFHNMLNDSMHFHRSEWQDYKQVNEAFAKSVRTSLKPKDLVWVHDYQLCLVPQMVRKAGLPKQARIGFFLHIPFPNYDIFRTLPWRKELLEGLLGASLIGFHVDEYCQHFFTCVEQILNLRCDRSLGSISYNGRTVHVRPIPIGIDAKSIYDSVKTPEIIKGAKQIRKEMNAKNLIVGVDRLDYTKGIFKRLRAFEVFLQNNPSYHGKVSMLQVAVPSRTEIASYQKLREDIERLVGHINGLYAKPHWTPLTYLCRSLPWNELLAYYCAADIGLVTPLRDGMNLVAKEYVACHLENPGVLILSDLAGAARQLTEAILVNPYDVAGIAEAIEDALAMKKANKVDMMEKLNTKIAHFDVYQWVDAFLSESLYVE